jgi:hypothetical protein
MLVASRGEYADWIPVAFRVRCAVCGEYVQPAVRRRNGDLAMGEDDHMTHWIRSPACRDGALVVDEHRPN